MNNKKIIIILAIVILVLTVAILIYAMDFYPAVIIGTSWISASDWNQGLGLAQKLEPSLSNQQIFDQMIKVKKEQELLSKLKVIYDTSVFIDESKFYATGKNEEYNTLIKDYFNSDSSLFLKYVVAPEVYDSLLRIKYNSLLDLNLNEYNRATNILSRINNGEAFEQLAKTESDDKVTGQLGGDLGFVTAGLLLPELDKAMISSPLGHVKPEIVVSRLGYHILYPVETANKDSQKLWHVKHILIKTIGYDSWLNSNLSRIWVWRIK